MVLLSKEEIKSEILGKINSPDTLFTLTLENVTIEELKGYILPEHSFQFFSIITEFTSRANRRYQAWFYGSKFHRGRRRY